MYVECALQQVGAPYIILDQERVLDMWVDLSVGSSIEAKLRLADKKIDLNRVSAVYVRTHNLKTINHFANAIKSKGAWQHVFEIEDAQFSWLELTSVLVVNHYSDMTANFSKPYQGALIQTYGFAVPNTVVTTDPGTVLLFQQKHKVVIYKSLGGFFL